MKIVRNKLFENPDKLIYDNKEYKYDDRDYDPIPFGYYEGKLYLGKMGGIHGDIKGLNDIRDKEAKITGKYTTMRDFMGISGRLWKDIKAISFWVYPSKKEFPKIITEIGNAIGEPGMLNDPEWKVEVMTKMLPNYYKQNRKDWGNSSVETEVIPIKDYMGSAERSSDELAQQHIASPMQKLKRPGQSAFFNTRHKKTKPLAWKQALVKSESMKEIVRQSINESPDGVRVEDGYEIEWDEIKYKPIVFGFYDDKFYWDDTIKIIGEFKRSRPLTHGDLAKKHDLKSISGPNEGKFISRDGFEFAGRLWKEIKIISFWNHPDKEDMPKILKIIGKETGIDFSDPEWRIEIKSDPNNNGWYGAWEKVPISNYIGSAKVSDQEKAAQHVMSPMLKKPNRSGAGVYKKSPPMAWKQRVRLGDSKNEIVRPNINESPDGFRINDKGFDVMDDGALAFHCFTDSNGNINELGINPEPGYHSDFPETQAVSGSIYPGRIFQEPKVITFWAYPSPKEFKMIIKLLEDDLNIKIFNNGWKVEVYLDDEDKPVEMGGQIYMSQYDENSKNVKFISVEDYVGSNDSPEEIRAFHLLSFAEKERLKKLGKYGKGFGSDRTAPDSKKPLRLRQAMYAESFYPRISNKL